MHRISAVTKSRLLVCLVAFMAIGVSGSLRALTFDDFLVKLEKVSALSGDYQCRISQWSADEAGSESKIMNFYFAEPRSIRVDVIEGTRGAGTTGVLRDDGKVEAAPDLPLIRVKFIFDLDHPMVTTNRGRTFDDASLLGIVESLQSAQKTCTLTAENGVDHGIAARSLNSPSTRPVTILERISRSVTGSG